MKILFLCSSFFPKIGGVEKHVWEISKILSDKGNEVIIFTQLQDNQKLLETKNYQSKSKSDNEAIKSKEIDKSIYFIRQKLDFCTVYYFNFGNKNWFRKFRIWRELLKKKDVIKQCDVIHCHDVFFWYLPFRFLFPKKHVFVTFHGYEDYPIPIRAVIVRKISEKLAFGNICIGNFITKWYGTKPSIVSYGAVDVKSSKFNPSSSLPSAHLRAGRASVQSSKLYKNFNSAVFVGRLDEQTGILTYLEVFKIVKKEIPDFKLTVVGDGKFKSKIKEKDIKVLGFKHNPIPYIRSNRFAFVSRYLSILEAMLEKRLVFAVYDNPVKEDYLKMAPFSKLIIISNSPKIIAEKIIYYLNNPDKEKKLTEKAYDWVTNQTWDKMVQNYLNLWEKNPGNLKISR